MSNGEAKWPSLASRTEDRDIVDVAVVQMVRDFVGEGDLLQSRDDAPLSHQESQMDERSRAHERLPAGSRVSDPRQN